MTSLREVDSVGRIGGEEFLVIAREATAEGAAALAERIRSTVASTPIEYRRRRISITVSLGFAVAPEGVQTDYTQMYELAAAALTAAKSQGRNRFVIWRVGEEPRAEEDAPSPTPATPGAV
jgi:diguanylate cyclase (GGDEF)-like protein